jgi:hypothetical protein
MRIRKQSYEVRLKTILTLCSFQNMHGFNVVDNGHHGLVQTVHHWDVPPNVTFASVGYNGTCDANYEGFREVDLDSPGGAKVLFDWNGRKISLNESTYLKYDGTREAMCRRGWDLLHVNAVDKFPDGDYLLSARHTDALYKICHTTGEIVWRLGGVMSDFELLEGVKFSRQHHARVLNQSDTHITLTVFDNAVGEHFQAPTSRLSRGLVISLDLTQKKASLIASYDHPQGIHTDGRGSFQILPSGNAFLNWATNCLISEHTPDGNVLMEASIMALRDTYRAFKHPWVGRPLDPPDVRSEVVWKDRGALVTQIHMSWNGATEVDRWNVKGLDADGADVDIVSDLPRSGFETSIEYNGYASNVYAEALDRGGKVLGTSVVTLGDDKTSNSGSSSRLPPISFGLVGGLLGALLSLAARWLYQRIHRRHDIRRQEEKGRYAPVVGRDEENWELAASISDEVRESDESEPLKPTMDR